ncbi:hypothetical protein DFH07DRAFT_968476 [Mycena maculata]|uniref:Uncharacterized protein n=1 Tax=Mycena maculata TaxID=230809 RepID=A0AAD7MVG2_9AGAR|nr:hypothetical protein DFH07DRAFT_968476 [Mycena maculata]
MFTGYDVQNRTVTVTSLSDVHSTKSTRPVSTLYTNSALHAAPTQTTEPVPTVTEGDDEDEDPYPDLDVYNDCDIPLDVISDHGRSSIASNFSVDENGGITRSGAAETSDAEKEPTAFPQSPEGLAKVGETSENATPVRVNNPTSTSCRDIDARSLATALKKLVGIGAEDLGSVIKNAIIGGVASGAAVEGVNAAAGQSSKHSVATMVVDDAAKAAEKSITSVISNGAAEGIGSALDGLGVGAAVTTLFRGDSSSSSSSKRAFTDLTDEEANSLLEYIGAKNTVSSRALSSIGKEIESLFRHEASFDGLD